MNNKVLKGVKAKTYWTTIYFIEPIAIPLAVFFSRLRWIRPNMITLSSLIFMIVATACFAGGFFPGGSLFYYLSCLLDKTDGKVARMTGQISELGAKLDISIDKINKLFPLLGIIYGYYFKQGQLLLGMAVIFGLHYGIHIVYHYLFKIKRSAANDALIDIPQQKRPALFGIGRIYDIFSPQDEAFFILVLGPLSGFITETIVFVSLIYLVTAPIAYKKLGK
ncbi:MAG: CDP-alcohol phosphatidyltransferase family protein [Candidatus Omnitrophica bacterium]|nr:CDP-alcohol phosphatidyltransferase family protein [Candidatus Omnitrophota bacterium]